MSLDPVKLASELIKIKSITPNGLDAINLIKEVLESHGFVCKILSFGKGSEEVVNLYARHGKKSPNLCFAGHVDVVPEGVAEEWSFEPFSGTIFKGQLCGRGAVDMKSSIATFISAVTDFLIQNNNFFNFGSISFLITSDEEGKAINGTKKVVEWLKETKEIIDDCIVGEPTNPNAIGEMIKIGRRGSYSGNLIVNGIQGHVGYPHLAKNPINKMLQLIEPLSNMYLDQGNENFEPSTVMITSIDVGNPSYNVIPSKVSVKFNIRFNDLHSSKSLTKMLEAKFKSLNVSGYTFDYFCNAEPFFTTPGRLVDSLKKAIKLVTGFVPDLSTNGGTSDARFIRKICPVIEFGLVGKLMHKVDEKVDIDDIKKLKEIYKSFLEIYFIE
mgnify:CR=1 FL=1|tara:strand:+ start:216 stop:1367 length:1152 start_codon:yes stop_codon:yes gene_type:complete